MNLADTIRKIKDRAFNSLLFLIWNVVAVILLFLVIEGFSSTLVIAYKLIKNGDIAETHHTEYDKELGWINVPNVYIEDMYGPGKYLKTNSQRYRNNKDFDKKVPSHKRRFICSGDSFTFGYGVDNEHSWCQLLAKSNENFEAINMGLGAYGFDQAYLWYKRNSNSLEHDVHIFAFITNDFERMQQDKFLGYDKPLLELRGDTLMSSNVPVPRSPFYVSWLQRNIHILDQLKSIRLAKKLFNNKNAAIVKTDRDQADKHTKKIVLKIIEDLQGINKINNSILVLVYLPTMWDYENHSSESWRQFFKSESKKNDFHFIDLIEDLRKLRQDEMKKMFISAGEIDYPESAGHYTEKGNEFIVNSLYRKLNDIPEISDRINREALSILSDS